MLAFLSNLANRQTDKQTRANAFTSSFVGGKNTAYIGIKLTRTDVICELIFCRMRPERRFKVILVTHRRFQAGLLQCAVEWRTGGDF